MKKLTVVVSCFNEENMLPQFYLECTQVLKECGWDYELIFVNDGSYDDSRTILQGYANINERVKIIDFTRNFGHEAAMIAGIDYASGDGIICMDADLQHPPRSIPDILSMFDKGFDVISMIRTKTQGSGPLKRIGSKAFYKVLNALSPIKFHENSTDFFGISRRAADVLRNDFRDRVRYLRGYVQSIGFRCGTIEFEAGSRPAGKTHYSFTQLLSYSITTLCGYSEVPLKIGIYAGLLAAVSGVILMIYSVIMKTFYYAPGGYTTIVVALCFLFSLTLIVLGIIGEYIAVILREVKDRPIYIIEKTVNIIQDPESKGQTKAIE